MNQVLRSWLDELRADGLHLTPNAGSGANENLWCVSAPSTDQIEVSEFVAFLRSAMETRRELAQAQPIRPVTFYAWHDEMAGQLRFSTACCLCSALPFRAKVRTVQDPQEIVTAFVQSPYRDGIPLSELEIVPEDPSAAPPLDDTPVLRVWAVPLT